MSFNIDNFKRSLYEIPQMQNCKSAIELPSEVSELKIVESMAQLEPPSIKDINNETASSTDDVISYKQKKQ